MPLNLYPDLNPHPIKFSFERWDLISELIKISCQKRIKYLWFLKFTCLIFLIMRSLTMKIDYVGLINAHDKDPVKYSSHWYYFQAN